MLFEIKERKLQYFGHALCNEIYLLLHLKIEGQRRPSRRETSWLRNSKGRYGLDSTSLFQAAASNIRIAMKIANLHREDGT